jgi:hypothetical protein
VLSINHSSIKIELEKEIHTHGETLTFLSTLPKLLTSEASKNTHNSRLKFIVTLGFGASLKFVVSFSFHENDVMCLGVGCAFHSSSRFDS